MLAWLGVRGLPVAPESVAYTLRAMATTLPVVAGVSLLLRAGFEGVAGIGLRAYVGRVVGVGWWVTWLRLWLACWATSFAYFWLKLWIPVLHPGRFDAALAAADAALHVGDPALALSSWLSGSVAARALDLWYVLWLSSVVIGLGFFAASPEERTRAGVALSCVLLWAVGALVYVALPAVGPVFASPEAWSGLATRMPRAHAAQDLLWGNYQALLAVASGARVPIDHRLGVAALPSLHVGFHVLFACWARRSAPPLHWLLWAMALATALGALATGWHYALDVYAGAALGWGCYRVGLWLEGLQPPRELRTT